MFTHLIEEVDRIIRNYRNIPIIVEGIKDKKVLNKLGFVRVFDISGTSLDRFADNLRANGEKSVIILTDFDKDGTSKALRLSNIFQYHHVKVISSVRGRIRSLFKIHKVEELSHFTKIIDLANVSSPSNIHDIHNIHSHYTTYTTSHQNYHKGDDHYGKASSIHDKIFNRSRVYSRRNSREARRHRSNIRPD